MLLGRPTIVRALLGYKDAVRKLIFYQANNHTYDFPKEIRHCSELLDQNGSGWFGLCMAEDQMEPCEWISNGGRYGGMGALLEPLHTDESQMEY